MLLVGWAPCLSEVNVTYYDRPLLKEPVWEWMVPAYYYVGGLTGASLVLGAAAQLGDAPARTIDSPLPLDRLHWLLR